MRQQIARKLFFPVRLLIMVRHGSSYIETTDVSPDGVFDIVFAQSRVFKPHIVLYANPQVRSTLTPHFRHGSCAQARLRSSIGCRRLHIEGLREENNADGSSDVRIWLIDFFDVAVSIR